VEIALEAVKKSDWDGSRYPLKAVIAHFGDRRVNADGNLLRMIGVFLKHVWAEDPLGLRASTITVAVLNEIAKREDSLSLLRSLWIWVRRMFGIDVVTVRRVKDVFDNWFEGGGGIVVIS